MTHLPSGKPHPVLEAAERVEQAAHSCDRECRADSWAMSGYRQTGDRWRCSCGLLYVHICDEADDCSWSLARD